LFLLLLLCLLVLSGCGGSGPATTATTTAYNGTASVGDFLQITVDPIGKTLSYSNLSNQATGTNIPYTVNSDGTYSFNDPDGHLLGGYEIPGYVMVLEVNNAGTDKATSALVFSAAQMEMTPTSFFGQKFNFMQFRTSNGGIEVGSVLIGAQGDLTVNTYQPQLELDTENTIQPGPAKSAGYAFENLGGITISPVSNHQYYLTQQDPGAISGMDYVFATPNSSLVVDTPLGTLLALPQGSQTFDPSFAGTYTLMYYKKQVSFITPQDVEQDGSGNPAPVTLGKATLTIGSDGTATLTESNQVKWSKQLQPVASKPYLFGTGSDGLLSDTCNGLFTFRQQNPPSGTGRQEVFISFLPGSTKTVFVSTFFVPGAQIVSDMQYTYRYGVAFPQ
jgi:hypothetical protein